MEMRYCKALFLDTKENEGRKVYTFRITNEVVDRTNERVGADGFDFSRYMSNPIVVNSHDYSSIEQILGRTLQIRRVDDGHEADIVFNDTPKGRLAQQLVDSGDLRATSIGFISHGLSFGKEASDPATHESSELLEISMVAVPANQEALRLRSLVGSFILTDPEPVKMAHPPHTSPKADEGTAWDAAAELRQAEGETQLWQMHAWRDSEGDPEAKSSYKLPHHQASGEVVWRGVAAGMAALLGARGGTSLPDGDRRGVWTHLARHYSQFGKETPELKSAEELKLLGSDEINGQFWEGEVDEMSLETKAGRRNSAKDMAAMKEAMGHMEEAMRLMNDVMGDMGGEDAMPDDDDMKSFDVDLSALEAMVRKDN